jgi:Tfp pilus assembly protein PilF
VDRHQQERALQAARRAAFLLCALAQDYYQSGQPERAMELLDSKVETLPQPVNADLFAMRAMLLMRSGRAENAQRDLETALRIDPENAIARRVVEQARQAMGR